MNSEKKALKETIIKLDKSIITEHNDILVCPSCFEKWDVGKRNISIDVSFTGNERPMLLGNMEYLSERLVDILLDDDIYCPYCGNGDKTHYPAWDSVKLITMDSGIYETIKLFNQKGYKTEFSCAGGYTCLPYIAFKLDINRIDKLLNLVKNVSMNKKLVQHDSNIAYFDHFEYTYDPNELPDEYEFMKDVEFNHWMNREDITLGVYPRHDCHINARDTLYKIASMLEDVSDRSEGNEKRYQ